MSEQTKAILKTYFETGDKPNQSQFENFIDSYQNLKDDNLLTSSEIGITATVGGGQFSGYPLTKYYSSVDSVTTNTAAVVAPKAALIKSFIVNSNGAFDLILYPAVGDNFKGESIDEAITLPKGFSYLFISISALAWEWLQIPSVINAPLVSAVWSDWSNKVAITFGATASAPTKATTKQNDFCQSRFLLKETEARFLYSATSGAGGAAGSGQYLLTLPDGFQFDSAKHPFYISTEPFNTARYSLGNGSNGILNSSTLYASEVMVIPYDATRFRLITLGPDFSNEWISSTRFLLSNPNIAYSLNFKFYRQ